MVEVWLLFGMELVADWGVVIGDGGGGHDGEVRGRGHGFCFVSWDLQVCLNEWVVCELVNG